MPTTVKTFLAYCDQCKIGLGWGALRQDRPTGHYAGAQSVFHQGTLVEIDSSEAIAQGEADDAFLARMFKKYVTKK